MLLTEAVLIAGTMGWDDCRRLSYQEGGNQFLKAMCYARIFKEAQFAELARLVADRSARLPLDGRRGRHGTYALVS
ncbi:MAG: hypothetical protein ABJA98_01775 [Acidobacteriota bacterium]